MRMIPILLLSLVVSAVHAEDWPQFRGPAGNGISPEDSFPTKWSRDENVKWRVELPGVGNSSPIVSAGKVFVTVAADSGRQRTLLCFDRDSGKRLWARTTEFTQVEPTHKTNPYAAATPAAQGERVVVWHGSAGLFCYDFDGKELWRRDLGDFEHMWGYGSSPIIHKDRVILYCGPSQEIFVTAIDLATGKTLWQTPEPIEGTGERNESGKYMGSWSTPVVTKVDGREVAVIPMPTRVNAYDVKTGELIFFCEGLSGPRGDLAYSSAMIEGDLCVSVGGYQGPSLGFQLGGRGNVTQERRLWRTLERNPQNIGTGVLLDGYVYKANAGPGVLQCLNGKTGEELWRARGEGGNFWGSVILAAGNLYVTAQDGTTVVFKPSPEGYQQVAANKLGEPSNATPAASDGKFFIRTEAALYCVGAE